MNGRAATTFSDPLHFRCGTFGGLHYVPLRLQWILVLFRRQLPTSFQERKRRTFVCSRRIWSVSIVAIYKYWKHNKTFSKSSASSLKLLARRNLGVKFHENQWACKNFFTFFFFLKESVLILQNLQTILNLGGGWVIVVSAPKNLKRDQNLFGHYTRGQIATVGATDSIILQQKTIHKKRATLSHNRNH